MNPHTLAAAKFARVLAIENGRIAARNDPISVEEPLEIRVNGQAISITMRTPGHDQELALGFLEGEGMLPGGPKGIRRMGHETPEKNVYGVETADPLDLERLKRHFYVSSSCGVCGKSSLKALATLVQPVEDTIPICIPIGQILRLPKALSTAQQTFAITGSLHATGLFTIGGDLICAYEDVGRHNAVDKAIGHAFWQNLLPLVQSIMVVSGRTSFEILQKAAMAGIPVVVAISGPSSLAVELAREFGITLVGFVRDNRCNVYAHPERLEVGN